MKRLSFLPAHGQISWKRYPVEKLKRNTTGNLNLRGVFLVYDVKLAKET